MPQALAVNLAHEYLNTHPCDPSERNKFLDDAARIDETLTNINNNQGKFVPASISRETRLLWIRGFQYGLLDLKSGIHRDIMQYLSAAENISDPARSTWFAQVHDPPMRDATIARNPHSNRVNVALYLLSGTASIYRKAKPCETCEKNSKALWFDGCYYARRENGSPLLDGNCLNCHIRGDHCSDASLSTEAPAAITQVSAMRNILSDHGVDIILNPGTDMSTPLQQGQTLISITPVTQVEEGGLSGDSSASIHISFRFSPTDNLATLTGNIIRVMQDRIAQLQALTQLHDEQSIQQHVNAAVSPPTEVGSSHAINHSTGRSNPQELDLMALFAEIDEDFKADDWYGTRSRHW